MIPSKAHTLLWLLITASLRSWSQGEEPKATLIFVCEHGGARSTIASMYFNKMAIENHLPYQSVFRGLTPDSTITKETEKGLKADGFDTSGLSTRALSTKDINSKTILISLDCTPSSYTLYEAWKGIPAISENYEAARNEILKRLNRLVSELKENQSTKK